MFNKEKKFKDLAILTPFRTKENGPIYIKIPAYQAEFLPGNAYCMENKDIVCFHSDHSVKTVDLLIEELV